MNATDINTYDIENLRQVFKDFVSERNKVKQNRSIICRDQIKVKQNRSIICRDQIYVMTYPNVKSRNGKQTLITEIVSDIRTKYERKKVPDKKELSIAYFSASSMHGEKCNAHVTKHSGLLFFDIDIKDNPNTDFVELKHELSQDKFTYICFNSPSGGIKLIFNTNISKLENHQVYYECIKGYLLEKYNLIIDTSGCNIARACYLPYDCNCYFNPHSSLYCLNDDDIENTISQIKLNALKSSFSKTVFQVGSISYDEHYDNILSLLKKWTEVGIYRNIFNNYRYNNIEGGVMGTSVPFLELIILQHSYPYRLNWNTIIDEYYFKGDRQKQLNVIDIGCTDGLVVCKIGFKNDFIIKERFRARTLGAMTMKLIFNNPFCHPDRLLEVIKLINDWYCEDPHPLNNPKPDDEEVTNIVMSNYNRFIAGELDFSSVINKKKDKIARKFVFRSKEYVAIDRSTTQVEACRAFRKGKKDLLMVKLQDAIHILQDGKKITNKRIAEYLSISTKTIGRHLTDEFQVLIKNYNKSIKK